MNGDFGPAAGAEEAKANILEVAGTWLSKLDSTPHTVA